MTLCQHTYELEVTRHPRTQTIFMNTPVNPKELMGAVNQAGKLKVHTLVDTCREKAEHEFLVVGTGRSIPEEYTSRLIRLNSLLFSDGQFGYTIYYLMPEVKDLEVDDISDELDDLLDSYLPVDSIDEDAIDDKAPVDGVIKLELTSDDSDLIKPVKTSLVSNMQKKMGIDKVVYDEDTEIVEIHVNKMLWAYDSMRKDLVAEIMGYSCVKHFSL